MENRPNYKKDAEKALLKRQALPFLPRNLESVEAQRQILSMVVQANPAISYCSEQAERYLWSKVSAGELSINMAVAQCAAHTDKAIEVAGGNGASLQTLSREMLMQSWIALDYYSFVLKPEYSIHIRDLQERVTDLLLNEQVKPAVDNLEATQPADAKQAELARLQFQMEDYEATQPAGQEDLGGTTRIEDYEATQPAQAMQNVQPVKPVQTVRTEIERTASESTQARTASEASGKKTKKRKKKQKNKAIPVIAAVVAVLLIVAGIFALNKVNQTKFAISGIGEVTLESEEKILKAEERYSELTPEQQEKVDNYDVLVDARGEYDSLVTEEAIEKIGKVTLESEEAIAHAEELYEELPQKYQKLVDNYNTLKNAREEYSRLTALVEDARNKINAIGEVTLESGEKIAQAREAYDNLQKDNLQKYVSDDLPTLENAEAAYDKLYGQDLYDKGMELYGKKKYDEAMEYFDTILAEIKDSALRENAGKAKADCQMGLAKAALAKRDYYTAVSIMDSVDEKYRNEDYNDLRDKIFTSMTNSRPASGAGVKGNIPWGYCYFELIAADKDVCFKLENENDPTQFKMVYVRAGKTAKVNVKDGTYRIKWATGDDWYGVDHLFGDNTQYMDLGTVDFETTTEGNTIYYWYLTVDLNSSDNDAEEISANQF